MEIGEEMIVTPQDAKGLKGKLFDGVTIKKMEKALEKGARIEISPQRDGNVKVRTVWRKHL